MSTVFAQLEAERAAIDRREGELAAAVSGIAIAVKSVQRLGAMHADDVATREELALLVKSLSAIASACRPVVRHRPKPPTRPAADAPLSELQAFQAAQTARLADENGHA